MRLIAKTISLVNKFKNPGSTLILNYDAPYYFLIEIKNPWSQSNALAYKIIQTIKESENDFEEALKEVNEMLSKNTPEEQSEWIGKLSAIIALINDNKLNITSLGNASCFLIRDQTINDITSEQPKEAPPSQTFTHILSGELKENDKIVIGTAEFFETIPIVHINQILNKRSLKQASLYIASLLRKAKSKSSNAFLIEILGESATPESPIYETIYIDQKPSRQFFKWLFKNVAAAALGMAALLGYLFKYFKKIKMPPVIIKHKKWVFVSLLAIAVIAFSYITIDSILKRKKATLTFEQRKIIMEAEDKNREAGEALKKGDKESAIKIYQEALSLAQQVKSKESNSLIDKINWQLEQLSNITHLKPKEVLDFSVFKNASVSQFFVVKKDIFAVDNKNNQIYQNKKNPNFLPQISGHFVAGAYQPQDNLLLLYQDEGGLYEYKIDENKIEQAKIVFGEKWQKAKVVETYFRNVYLLNPDEGQIYKYERLATGYSKGHPYVDQSKINLKNAISMSVDGYIYVLKSDKTVVKLMAGRLVSDFSLVGIPDSGSELKNPIKIFARPETPNLYILDDNRVLEFDKSGRYLKMFVIDGLADIKDFWVSPEHKKIYLLSGTKIYSISAEF